MVSIRDGAIPDADNLGDSSSDPFHGTIFAGEYDTIDPSGDDGYTYEDPSNDPESDEYEPPNLDFGDDDVPDDSDPVQDVNRTAESDDSGLLATAGVGAAGLLVGLIVAGVAVLGGD